MVVSQAALAEALSKWCSLAHQSFSGLADASGFISQLLARLDSVPESEKPTQVGLAMHIFVLCQSSHLEGSAAYRTGSPCEKPRYEPSSAFGDLLANLWEEGWHAGRRAFEDSAGELLQKGATRYRTDTGAQEQLNSLERQFPGITERLTTGLADKTSAATRHQLAEIPTGENQSVLLTADIQEDRHITDIQLAPSPQLRFNM